MNKIIGRKPVLEALEADVPIFKLYLQYTQSDKFLQKIKRLADKRGIKVSEVSSNKFKELEEGQRSQGVIALRSDYDLYTLNEILSGIDSGSSPLLLVLDSIQDPHNLGAILRTAEAAGVDGVISTLHHSAPLNEIVEKASAGAVSHLKISLTKNLNRTLEILKKEGFWIIGSKLGDAETYTEVDYNMPIALVLGNEEKGIRRLIAENCDYLIEIPMAGKIQSLNVSVAAGILLFEILRQRKIREN